MTSFISLRFARREIRRALVKLGEIDDQIQRKRNLLLLDYLNPAKNSFLTILYNRADILVVKIRRLEKELERL